MGARNRAGFPALLLAAALVLGAGGCTNPSGPEPEPPPAREEKTFSLPAGATNILVNTNLSAYGGTVTQAIPYGRAAAPGGGFPSAGLPGLGGGDFPRPDMEAASRFNAAPPPAASGARSVLDYPARSQTPPVEGAVRDFFVDTNFRQIRATLRKQGTACNIWTPDVNYGSSVSSGDGRLTADQITALQTKFDQIYPLAHTLLGYELGGEPGGNGGRDGDPRIQILVYDINEGGTVGYFWGKDEYPQALLNAAGQGYIKSNVMEMFYISAYYADYDPDMVYSTLVHEFQHMINFNRKHIARNLVSETWYDEMLSMLAEDVISPLIGIGPTNSGHPINVRIPYFLGAYPILGVDQWVRDDREILCYSTTYAFGAYLIRNNGGPALIKAMLDNGAVNQASITAALRTTPGVSSRSFEEALGRYAEALVYSGTHGGVDGKMSFHRAQSSSIDGTPYTAEAFDIWAMSMPLTLLRDYQSAYPSLALPDTYRGPIIYPLLASYAAPGHSVCLQKISDSFLEGTGPLRTFKLDITRPGRMSPFTTGVLSY